MAGSGIKAKVLGGFFSSKGLLTGNVVELVPMKMWKKHKKHCMFIEGGDILNATELPGIF